MRVRTGEIRRKIRRRGTASALAIAMLALTSSILMTPAFAGARIIQLNDENRVGKVSVVAGTSESLKVNMPFSDIVVGDPEIADVNPMTNQSLYVLGRKLGMTNVTLFDMNKQVVAVIDIEVTQNLEGIKQALHQSFPKSSIKVRSVNGRILLEGQVASAPAAEKAMSIARDFAGDLVTNSLTIADNQQVNLEVRFVEVSRLAGKDLGINWNLTDNGGKNGFKSGSLSPVAGALSGALPFGSIVANILSNGVAPDVLITALEQKNLARRLAEPNLTTLSGQPASFHAGGQVPVCTVSSNSTVVVTANAANANNCSVTYKDFGVQLEFTPVVLDDGLINLTVAPEVSDIDNSININGNPGFTTRRARTSVELRDGQSFAIAGLLQTINAKTASQVPWIGDVPVLGTLFRSSSFQKKESDLVIIVTPRLARPTGRSPDLQTPLDATLSSNEPEFFLLGKQEVSRKELDKKFNGQYGYIIDVPEVNYGAPSK